MDRALYLPREEWADDPLRREEAGVPDEVRFATKGELAKEMLGRAFEAKVPARWVVADTVYGTARGLRGWLEEQGRSYVLAVPSTKGIYHHGRQRQARTVAKSLAEGAWIRASAGRGSKEIGSTTGPACRCPLRIRRKRGAGCSCAGRHRRSLGARLLLILRAEGDVRWRVDPNRGKALGHRGLFRGD